jgi:hypothetical protein
MIKKKLNVIEGEVEKFSVPDGKFPCPICGMRYKTKAFAEHCCAKIARHAPSLRA